MEGNVHGAEPKQGTEHTLLSEGDLELEDHGHGQEQDPDVREDVDGRGGHVVFNLLDASGRHRTIPESLHRETDHEIDE